MKSYISVQKSHFDDESNNYGCNENYILTKEITQTKILTPKELFPFILHKLEEDSIIELTINCDSFNEQELVQIFSQIAKNNSLLKLTIHNQVISVSAAIVLSDALADPHCVLQSLAITSSLIIPSSLERIIKSLKDNKSLASIALENKTYLIEEYNSHDLLTSEGKLHNKIVYGCLVNTLQINYIITSVSLGYYLAKDLIEIINRNRVFFINAVNCLQAGVPLDADTLYSIYTKIASPYLQEWSE